MSGYQPAFPLHPATANPGTPMHGMTLRDWFAGQAVPGLLSAPRDTAYGYVVEHTGPDKIPPVQIAILAYEIADAMLAERERAA